MKKIFSMIVLTLSVSAFAHIDPLPGDAVKVTTEEINSSRSCFEEVMSFGCKHPREDQAEFRSCMSNVHASLSSSCQKMMSELYGK